MGVSSTRHHPWNNKTKPENQFTETEELLAVTTLATEFYLRA